MTNMYWLLPLCQALGVWKSHLMLTTLWGKHSCHLASVDIHLFTCLSLYLSIYLAIIYQLYLLSIHHLSSMYLLSAHACIHLSMLHCCPLLVKQSFKAVYLNWMRDWLDPLSTNWNKVTKSLFFWDWEGSQEVRLVLCKLGKSQASQEEVVTLTGS